jgi:voltage-gated potassium channel
MLLGYSIIAVPTGIFSAELLRRARGEVTARACPHCSAEGHDADARFCKQCGGTLAPPAKE